MTEESTLVLLEDIAFTEGMEAEARKLGGSMQGALRFENAALFSLPTNQAASDFMFIARQKGYQASIQKALFPSPSDILGALQEDAERVRRALRKQMPRPPWSA